MTPIQFKRRTVLASLGASVLSSAVTPALAQSPAYPNRPIKIIVPWAAGGGGDVIVRLMGTSLQKRLGQAIVVDNRPGAVGTIGSLAAARSPADGYTLVYGGMESHTIAPQAMKKAPYDPRKDFVAIAPLGFFPAALVVSASHPAKTLNQFLLMAKDAKTPMSLGSWSTATSGHLMMEALKEAKGVDLLHVPYNGTAPLLQAQLSQQVDCSINVLSTVEPHIRNGALRVLAVSMPQRLPEFPDVPTLKELGLNVERGPWVGIFGPGGLPADVLARVHEAVDATLKEPAIVEQTKKMFFVVEHMEQRAYQNFYLSEIDRWGQYIKTAKIAIE
ncbi:tripartite tricarboxylate transporter substrate binding protein [Curvibacter sp. HBC61]|uniref:Tripartite tricarboxylate transporter substrate binding protein n=1 Tax=Curvibacter cyanobacteriorum TaxID=3026422 RepID=A0ABT5MWD7_9BURK|nr:tripartite tricarboxylate transporter substrate binding protein [Curvibacter sp. HBC61]MDD0837097.1 tripartite tricarboxylate transporter substrate binding protein [Curvibacter sp. HBC61]